MSGTKTKAKKKEVQEDVVVWAFRGIKSLNNQTGYVTCDSKLANKLIKSGDVQSMDVGALGFKEIESETPAPKEKPAPKETPAKEVKESKKVIEREDTKTK